MASFSKTYKMDEPIGSDLANQLDTFLQNAQTAFNQRYLLEHYEMDHDNGSGDGATTDSTDLTAQGRHRPGRVQAVYVGTTIQIAALTDMVKGCLAYDTDTGQLQIYGGASWSTYAVGGTSSILFQAKKTSLQAIGAGTHKVTFQSEIYDIGSGFDLANDKFLPTTEGVYRVHATVNHSNVLGSSDFIVVIYKNGVSYRAGTQMRQGTAADMTQAVSCDVYLDGATDYIEVYVVADNGGNLTANQAYFEGSIIYNGSI